MELTHCMSCFRLFVARDACCEYCGVPWWQPEGDFEPPVITYESVSAEPRKSSALLWSRRGLVLALLVTISAIGVDSLASSNRAAQASWSAHAQLGGQRHARQIELQTAADSLGSLYQELVSHYSDGAAANSSHTAWSLRWRDKLNQVPHAYRLHAAPAVVAEHQDAEENIRSAMLYLTSLERALALGQGPETTQTLGRSMEASLEEANEALR